MITVQTMRKTGARRPSQWEGKTDDGRMVYARYRWGTLTVHVSDGPTEDVLDAADAAPILEKRLGDEWDSELTTPHLIAATRDAITWPSRGAVCAERLREAVDL